MKRISEKMKAQKVKEKELSVKLWLKQKGRCAKCKCDMLYCFPPPSKHEIIRRSQGGDPLDGENCQMLCGVCHLEAHGHKVVD